MDFQFTISNGPNRFEISVALFLIEDAQTVEFKVKNSEQDGWIRVFVTSCESLKKDRWLMKGRVDQKNSRYNPVFSAEYSAKSRKGEITISEDAEGYNPRLFKPRVI